MVNVSRESLIQEVSDTINNITETMGPDTLLRDELSASLRHRRDTVSRLTAQVAALQAVEELKLVHISPLLVMAVSTLAALAREMVAAQEPLRSLKQAQHTGELPPVAGTKDTHPKVIKKAAQQKRSRIDPVVTRVDVVPETRSAIAQAEPPIVVQLTMDGEAPDASESADTKPYAMSFMIAPILRANFGSDKSCGTSLSGALLHTFGEGWVTKKTGNPPITYLDDISKKASRLNTSLKNTVDRFELARLNTNHPRQILFEQVYREINYEQSYRLIQKIVAGWNDFRT